MSLLHAFVNIGMTSNLYKYMTQLENTNITQRNTATIIRSAVTVTATTRFFEPKGYLPYKVFWAMRFTECTTP